MHLTNNKKWICLLTAICVSLSFTLPASSQTSPSWGIHDPSGTGNNLPPNQGSFVRQDPMPENLKDISIYSSDHKGITLTVSFPDFFDYEKSHFDKNYLRYKANNQYSIISPPGEPEILHRIIWLQVPQDAKNFEINVHHKTIKEDIKENIHISPAPEIIFHDHPDGYTYTEECFTKKSSLYEENSWYPKYDALMIEEGTKRSMKVISLGVPVMFYNPKKSQIQEIQDVTLTVHFQSETIQNSIPINIKRDPFHQVFNNFIPNYSYISAEPPPGHSQGTGEIREIRGNDLINPDYEFYPEYLIIAAQLFDRPESSLHCLAQHRSSQVSDLNIAIAYAHEINEIYENGLLLEEKIKAFIQMVYHQWRPSQISPPNLHYVLLIGDADKGGEVYDWFLPTWATEGEQAGDYDYSWLGDDDTASDVLLGRLPAASHQELSTMINKTIDFETSSPCGENHYGTRTVMLYGNFHKMLPTPEPQSQIIRDLLISERQELIEFHTDYLKGLDLFNYDSDSVTSILNEKGALFVGYSGHGGADSWGPNVETFNLENKDHQPVLVFSAACYTAMFDFEYRNSYSEQWIKNPEGGSISFFGATRWAAHRSIIPVFFDSVFKSHVHNLGPAIDITRWSMCKINRQVFVLLGDPAINFSSYIDQSSKIDLEIVDTRISPLLPSQIGETMKISYTIQNNSEQNAYNVPLKIFSIESGSLLDFIEPSPEAIDIPAQGQITQSFEWEYQGESSRHLMIWIDPDNTLQELSKFNNALHSLINYFPIYVDRQNTSGIEHGTLSKPFRSLSEGIAYAFHPDVDLIGENFRYDRDKAVEVIVSKGWYGSGETIDSQSLFLTGKDGYEKTIVYDRLKIQGSTCHIRDITFDGRKSAGQPAISLIAKDVLRNDDFFVTRNVFRNIDDFAINILNNHNSSSDIFFTKYNIINNIFTKNLGNLFLRNETGRAHIDLINNTMTNNEKNLFLSLAQSGFSTILGSKNNIMWDTGKTDGDGFYPQGLSASINFTNTNDPTIWDIFHPSPFNTFEKDPRFKDPQKLNFHLKADSPCIDTGDPQKIFNDPDGTRNDMGAHGGPESTIRPIRIIKPLDGQTFKMSNKSEITMKTQWTAYKLPEDANIRIQLYHYELEQAFPDKSFPGGTSYTSGRKVIDFDEIVKNNGFATIEFTKQEGNQTYYLTISDPEVNIGDFEKITFKIMVDSYALEANR